MEKKCSFGVKIVKIFHSDIYNRGIRLGTYYLGKVLYGGTLYEGKGDDWADGDMVGEVIQEWYNNCDTTFGMMSWGYAYMGKELMDNFGNEDIWKYGSEDIQKLWQRYIW